MGLDELLAREAIRDCLFRYCRAIDRADRALFETVYWPEALDDRGNSFRGKADQAITWLLERVGEMTRTQHMLGNILIVVDGTAAQAESYFRAYHRFTMPDGVVRDEFIGGRYLDRFEQRQGEWRMIHRQAIFDWFRTATGEDPGDDGYHGRPYGQRIKTDPSRSLFPATAWKR